VYISTGAMDVCLREDCVAKLFLTPKRGTFFHIKPRE
jgi:hypothetical protein